MLAGSHPPLVHQVTRPVKPVCHSKVDTHTHIRTHTPFQLLDQGVVEEDENAKRQIRKWAKETEFLLNVEKAEALFTHFRAFERKGAVSKLSCFQFLN